MKEVVPERGSQTKHQIDAWMFGAKGLLWDDDQTHTGSSLGIFSATGE